MSIEHHTGDAAEGVKDVSSGPRAKACGDCSLCCKVLRVNALEKPAGQWCTRLAEGGGCASHSLRPQACSAFQCFWSISGVLDEAWKPNRSGMVLWSNVEGRLIVDVDPDRPDAWREEPYLGQFRVWADRNRPLHMEVLIRVQGRMLVLFPEGEVDLGAQPAESAVDSGYYLQDGRLVPYARFVAPATQAA